MNVLVIGRGGREHAIIDSISKSKLKPNIYCIPGNAGIAKLATCIDINETDNQTILEFVKKSNISFVIVGPEVPLFNGLVDVLEQANIKVFGPNKNAAIIEGSKEFAKDLMIKYNVPTAKYQVFSDYNQAIEYVNNNSIPTVIKYDGLAAGKGVVVAMTLEEATNALHDMLVKKIFGDSRVVIEEYLEGPEFSLMALVNGNNVYPLAIAQDHKRAYNNDQGPNTGGMGAYSDVPFIPNEVIEETTRTIMQVVADAMVTEGRSFKGVLYGGLILTKEGPKVIEFNSRFGDPETEVVLPRLKSDLLEVMIDLVDGKDIELEWHELKTIGVVLAAKGYPGEYEKNFELNNIDYDGVYHMGTKFSDNRTLSVGGRVLFVLGTGSSFANAKEDAYKKVYAILEKNGTLFSRDDIGYQVLK